MHASTRQFVMVRASAGWLACLAWLACVLGPVGTTRAGGIFDLGTKPPDRVVVTLGDDLPGAAGGKGGAGSAMLTALAGVAADLDSKAIAQLRASASAGTLYSSVKNTAGRPDAPVRLWVVHAMVGEQHRRIEIDRATDGSILATAAEPDGKSRTWKLNRLKFEQLSASWTRLPVDLVAANKTAAQEFQPQAVIELAQPYLAGWFTMDQAAMGERLLGGPGRTTAMEPAKRELAKESFLLRLPKGWTPRMNAGLLVWVDAGPRAALHQPLLKACDELGFVLIAAADSGNERLAPERYQLGLDAVATACDRYLIDRGRVYVSGISGGGKIATHLWAGFPEVFTGAAPIVGLGGYARVPADELGVKQYATDYVKPPAAMLALLTTHRCAPITGDKDFNHLHIVGMAGVMATDKLPVRVFDIPGMAHQLPSEATFLEAMKWVDEPTMTARAAAERAGEEALRHAPVSGSPLTDERRAALVEVTRLASWSAAAWRASDELAAARELVKPKP